MNVALRCSLAGQVLVLFAVLTLPGLAMAQQATPLPRVDVIFQFDSDMPDDFRPPGQNVPQKLKTALEAEAQRLFNSRFGYLRWVNSSESTEASPGIAAIAVVLHQPDGMLSPIKLTCRFIGAGEEVALGEANVFDARETFPYPPSRVAEKTTDKAKSALKDIMDLFAEQHKAILKEISIAGDVNVLLDDERLEVPVSAKDLNCGRKSKLRLELDNAVGGELILVQIILQPATMSQSRPEDLQRCKVRLFSIDETKIATGWHDDIPKVLKPDTRQNVRVFVDDYVRHSEATALSPFSSTGNTNR